MNNILNENVNLLVKKENNFDFIRYFFAFSLVVVHFCTLTGVDQFWFVSGGMRVKAFFILSGFLVFNSFIRKPNIKDYISKRTKRILPAYLFVILLCFIIGMFLTETSLVDYLESKQTYKYILANISFLNFIQPELPGVFSDNPIHAMNGSLWSMKVEVLFYVSVPIIFYLLKRYNKLIIMLSIFAFAIIYNELFQYLYERTNNTLYLLLKRQIGSQFIYFYAGTFILLYFDYFCKYIKYLFPIAIILFILRDSNIILHYMESLTFATIIIGFAYNFKYLNFLRKYDNLSYGIYLYHFPIIQTLIYFNLHKTNIYITFALSLALTLLLAIVSWHILEKPILSKKKSIWSFNNLQS